MTSLRAVAARGRQRVRRLAARRFGPVVTVVVPVFQAEPYLDECLTSLLAQTHSRLQVVVVDDGSTDGSRAIGERFAAADSRVTLVHQENRGLGAARNAGIARARGTYLTFLDADDTLPPKAYADMVSSLEKSGSDFVTGGVERVADGRRSRPGWSREVHEIERAGITIDEFPRAVRDVIACNRMFRLSSWHSMGLSFPEGVAYEDHLPMMTAYVRGRFDVLRATTYLWRIREDHSSIGQQKHTVSNLRDRLEAKRRVRAVLEAEASQAVLDAWQARVLDMDLRLFIDETPGVDDDYWSVLRSGVLEHVDRATPQAWADVRVEQRVRTWLVADDHRPELEALIARRATGEVVVAARVEGNEVRARADLPDSVQPPAWMGEVGVRETALAVTLRAVEVAGDELVLVLAPRLGPVTDGVADAVLSARLSSADGRTWGVPAEPADPATSARWGSPLTGAPWPDIRVLRLSLGDFPAGASLWELTLDYSVGALTRSSPITYRDPDSSAGRPSPVVAQGRALIPRWAPRRGLLLALEEGADALAIAPPGPPVGRPLLVVEQAALDAHGVVLRGRWLGEAGPDDVVLVGENGVTLHLDQSEDGGTFELAARWDRPPTTGVWRLRGRGSPARLWVSNDLLQQLPIVVDTAHSRLAIIRDVDDAPALRVIALRG